MNPFLHAALFLFYSYFAMMEGRFSWYDVEDYREDLITNAANEQLVSKSTSTSCYFIADIGYPGDYVWYELLRYSDVRAFQCE